jgi:membrane associated rhomboid family serine protease
MPERELFVVCNNCGNEVSPYVTECPYCGHRLRKRAPDLKKQRKLEEKSERKAEKKRERLRAQYEGGGGDPYGTGASPGAWLETAGGRPIATIILVVVAILASILAASGFSGVSPWMLDHLILFDDLSKAPASLVTAPFLQFWVGYGFVVLTVFALFGAAIERRFGALAVVAVWVIGGALGVLAEWLIAAAPLSYGAYGAAAAAFVTWMIVVVRTEDLRDHDALGIAAVAFVICALPLATSAASVWTLIGGMVGGLICGSTLARFGRRSS